MKVPIYILTKPSNICAAASVLSFGAWAFPDFGVLQKGFSKPAALDPVAILVLLSWHVIMFVGFRTGEFFGEASGDKRVSSLPVVSLEADLLYYLFTIIAAIGLLATSAKVIGSLSLEGATGFVLSGQANEMKEAIYDNYHVGIMSLRYVVAYPGSLALYRLITRRRISMSIVINLLLLLLVALITGRLLVIATVLTTILLLNLNIRYRKIRISRVLLIGALLFSLLGAFNSSRNYGYYKALDLGFWSSNLAQILTYLGCSPQVALGTAARTDDLVGAPELRYRELVDVDEQLNAVSAFVELHEHMGYWCWPYLAFVCTTAGFAFSYMVSKGKTVYLLPCGVILYAAADLWRIDIFSKGLFVALMVVGIGVPLLLSMVNVAAAPKRIAA